jgi:hypothetical protein
MDHVGLIFVGAKRNSLLYNVGVMCVSMLHGRMTLIGAIRKFAI